MSYQGAITDSDVINGLSVRYLKIFGVWQAINDYRSTGKSNTAIKYQVIVALLYYSPYLSFQCLSFFVVKVDIQKATFLILHALIALQICSKLLVFWLHMDIMCRLLSLMKKDFIRPVPESLRGEVKEIFLKMSKNCNMVCMAVLIANVGGIAMTVADPQTSIDYLTHHTGDMGAVTGGEKKILGGWYPMPMAESPYYEVIYVYEAVGVIFGGTILTVYVLLFYQVLMCLYLQFTVLGYYISLLTINFRNTFKKRNLDNYESFDSFMYKELYEILLQHQKLLSYANNLRRVFNPLITIILGMGIFVLTISVFQFGGARNIGVVIRSLQYVAYGGIEICVFCFGSSSVEKASSDLHFAIYSSDWYKADTKFRRVVQMVMLRTRKGETLTAVRMYPVNVETILSIFQFTYSVSALMTKTA